MKKFLLHMAVICILYLIITNAQKSVIYAVDAMNICFSMIIPTLFPFFICSGLLIYSGFCESLAKVFRFCMMPLFRINPAGSSAFILGIVSGYPLGAVTAAELYSNNYIYSVCFKFCICSYIYNCFYNFKQSIKCKCPKDCT